MTTKAQAAKAAEEYKAGWGIDITAAPKKAATGDEFADAFNEGEEVEPNESKEVVEEPK